MQLTTSYIAPVGDRATFICDLSMISPVGEYPIKLKTKASPRFEAIEKFLSKSDDEPFNVPLTAIVGPGSVTLD